MWIQSLVHENLIWGNFLDFIFLFLIRGWLNLMRRNPQAQILQLQKTVSKQRTVMLKPLSVVQLSLVENRRKQVADSGEKDLLSPCESGI